MNHLKKFLIVGAVALGNSTAAIADWSVIDIKPVTETPQSTHIEDDLLKIFSVGTSRTQSLSDYYLKELNPIITNSYNNGVFTEKAHIKIKLSPNNTQELTDNYFYRKLSECHISINFTEDGKIPYLGKDNEIEQLVTAQNPTQKKLLREFITLHEHNHCEFSNFEQPIKIRTSNKNPSNILSAIADLSELDMGTSYYSTVNESFADVNTAINLIKTYGFTKDVQFIIESVTTQRKDNYFHIKHDSHFSHHALEELLKESNLELLQNLELGHETNSFALELANLGAAKTFKEKSEMRTHSFSDLSLFASVSAETGRKLYSHLFNKDNIGLEFAHKHHKNNIVTSMTNKVLEDQSIKQFISSGKTGEEVLFYIFEYLQKNQNSYQSEINTYRELISDLNYHIDKTIDSHKTALSFDDNYSEEAIKKNISKLRSDFSKRSHSIKNNHP